jgi:hypothetical protein
MQERVDSCSGSGEAPVDLPIASSKSGSSLWNAFKLGMKSTTRDMSDQPTTVESADTHALPPSVEDAWPDAPDFPLNLPDNSSDDDDDGVFDIDDLMDTSLHRQTAEIPTAEPAPALLTKRHSGNGGSRSDFRPRLSTVVAPSLHLP